mmetsp:Transcript_122006/g.352491  ORF Transcript_122006/g.352491 Transcript_122006/m.352491 type:complete len:451 (+) Transcript_122006:112-1464(+)
MRDAGKTRARKSPAQAGDKASHELPANVPQVLAIRPPRGRRRPEVHRATGASRRGGVGVVAEAVPRAALACHGHDLRWGLAVHADASHDVDLLAVGVQLLAVGADDGHEVRRRDSLVTLHGHHATERVQHPIGGLRLQLLFILLVAVLFARGPRGDARGRHPGRRGQQLPQQTIRSSLGRPRAAHDFPDHRRRGGRAVAGIRRRVDGGLLPAVVLGVALAADRDITGDVAGLVGDLCLGGGAFGGSGRLVGGVGELLRRELPPLPLLPRRLLRHHPRHPVAHLRWRLFRDVVAPVVAGSRDRLRAGTGKILGLQGVLCQLRVGVNIVGRNLRILVLQLRLQQLSGRQADAAAAERRRPRRQRLALGLARLLGAGCVAMMCVCRRGVLRALRLLLRLVHQLRLRRHRLHPGRDEALVRPPGAIVAQGAASEERDVHRRLGGQLLGVHGCEG